MAASTSRAIRHSGAMRSIEPGMTTSDSIRTKLARRFVHARRDDVERAGAFVLVLAIEQRRAAVPAKPRHHRLRLAAGTVLLIARKVDDVTPWRYDFLNHCCPPA